MWLLILEALGALALLGGAVWWTMFSGRRRDTEQEVGDGDRSDHGDINENLDRSDKASDHSDDRPDPPAR